MSDWAPRLAEAGPLDLEAAVERLFEEQASAWPLLASGLVGLGAARSRTLQVGSGTVILRHIPHRLRSTTARVDPASIGARPCFLCQANLPPEQRGVAAGEEWVILCNPFPILDRHLTIVHREHRPQRLAGRIGALLSLARQLPGCFVIYNGPECGASAPDHLHFQACSRSLFPIEADTAGQEGLLDHPARPIVLRDEEPTRLVVRLERVIATLAERMARPAEPLVNLAAFRSGGWLQVAVFARRRHRPQAFESGELLVSPAAIDLCGVLVTPRAEDFERLTAKRTEAILDEVILDASLLAEVVAAAGARP